MANSNQYCSCKSINTIAYIIGYWKLNIVHSFKKLWAMKKNETIFRKSRLMDEVAFDCKHTHKISATASVQSCEIVETINKTSFP